MGRWDDEEEEEPRTEGVGVAEAGAAEGSKKANMIAD